MKTLLDSILFAFNEASDVHLNANEYVAFRMDGEIQFTDAFGKLSNEIIEKIAIDIVGEEKVNEVKDGFEHDFAYTSNKGSRYRCVVSCNKGNLSLSLRLIMADIPDLDQIGAPDAIKEFLRKRQGLILISGPAGSGKTTTMAAMLNWINYERNDHIITIEDPIEHVIESQRCFVTQHELNSDTKSFSRSIRSALRQDANVIAIGEMRDKETIETVLKLCNTGHLVISTIHSASASQTFQQILSLVSSHKQELVLSQLSESLIGIVNQRLLPGMNGKRRAVFEVMKTNNAIKSAIKRNDISQIDNSVQTGLKEGMVTFEKHLESLIKDKIIHPKEAQKFLEKTIYLYGT